MFYVLITPVIYLLIHRKSFGLITCLLALLLPLLTPTFLNINTNFQYGNKIYNYTLTIQSLSFYNFINLPPTISGLNLVLLLLSLYFASDFFLAKIKTIPNFTKESFPLYTLHTYFIAIIIKLIYLINPNNSLMLLINELSSTLITILIVVSISYLLHQKLPKLYSVIFRS